MSIPSYLELFHQGVLRERVEKAYELLSSCTVCPRQCGVNRLEGGTGSCHTGLLSAVASYGPHFGEESPLVGHYGSGTIFFTHCTLRCSYCQNYTISQQVCGREISCDDLADIMLELQGMKCHNINLVSPTHVVPQILSAVEIAASKGLFIPLVYNTGTYDMVTTLRLLDGVVDIYMPDTKYGQDDIGKELSGVPDYTTVMKEALLEMHRQVGDLVCGEGIAARGMIIRHLVLPDNLAGSEIVMDYIGSRISRDSYVNIMAQYRPVWRVVEKTDNPLFLQMQRPVTLKEYYYAVACARKAGLHRGFEE
jgi:putative pyruvate formate lyase activating enzyme